MKKLALAFALMSSAYQLFAPPKKGTWAQVATQSQGGAVARNTEPRIGDLGIRTQATLNDNASEATSSHQASASSTQIEQIDTPNPLFTQPYGASLLPQITLHTWPISTVEARADETLRTLRDKMSEEWGKLDNTYLRPDRIERALEKLLDQKNTPEEEKYLGFAQNLLYFAKLKGYKSNYVEEVLQWNEQVSIKKCKKVLELISKQYEQTQSEIEKTTEEYETKIKTILKKTYEDTREDLQLIQHNRSLYQFVLTLGSHLQSDTIQKENENLKILQEYQNLIGQLAHYRDQIRKKIKEYKDTIIHISNQSSAKNFQAAQQLSIELSKNETSTSSNE